MPITQAPAGIVQDQHVPAPDEWTSTFTDPRPCAAIVDRLTFDARIITTGTDSYRLRTAQARHQATRT
jgi:DNA replication protein DnaC